MKLAKIQTFSFLLLEKLVQITILFYVYLPIILAILYPMVFIIPIFFISGVIMIVPGMWLSAYYLISPAEMLPLIIVEIFIFSTGLSIFLVALIKLAQIKLKGEIIAQDGIYSYIRHPQHLGIILMALPFALYIPWIDDFGIRVGDLLTWCFFSLILFFYSIIEDYRLRKRFPKEFSEYQSVTGFMFPKIIQNDRFQKLKWIKERPFLKYTLFIIGVVLFLVLSQFIVEYLISEGVLVAFK